MNCTEAEKKLIAYLDGKLSGRERRQIESHLAGCGTCSERAVAFRSLWSMLEELPKITPSASFDARIKVRVQQEPRRTAFWSWILPSPRMAFAATALVIASVWLSSFQPSRLNVTHPPITSAIQNTESDFRMIQDLGVLENYDVLTSFDALSELPVQQNSQPQPLKQM